MRWLALLHRYLGIAIGLLLAMWCLSGVVMMYVGYPQLTQSRTVAGLEPIALQGCCSLAVTSPASGFHIEMLAGRPVLQLEGPGPARLFDLRSGERLRSLTPAAALKQAERFSAAAGISAQPNVRRLVEDDQWTLTGVSNRDRPLYDIALRDRADTHLYVSSVNGHVVQLTTSRQRLWNWIGAVPHWLYFFQLRHHPSLWTQVVLWASLAGIFLTGTGLWLGVDRFVRRPAGRWSPLRGLLLWHHLPGLVFGVLLLTWVASGWVSLNPWGLLESDGPGAEQRLIRGAAIPGIAIEQVVDSLTRVALPADTVRIESAPLDEQVYLIATTATGRRIRLGPQGSASPLTRADIDGIARVLGSQATAQLITAEDAYYFSHHAERVVLPAYRLIRNDAQRTRYYLDPVSGVILEKIDSPARWYRWLHEGVHRMDFSAALRTRPLWDVVMLILMSGVTAVAITGAILGIRRWRI